jgi:hypothetical protein
MSELQSKTQLGAVLTGEQPKLAYVAPVLTLLGDVRDLTLGGSPGSGDSGNPGAERF